MKRIADGVWQAGHMLPSEPDIAADLGVSPGTVRKALDELTAENLVVRRQGRGTYVARHDDARILFQFFKIVPDSGEREFPDSRSLGVGSRRGRRGGRDARPRPAAPVLRARAGPLLGGRVCVLERIVLPEHAVPRASRRRRGEELPSNLYELYRTAFGVTIGRAAEKLKAVAAPPAEVAGHLGVPDGEPLLAVDRLASPSTAPRRMAGLALPHRRVPLSVGPAIDRRVGKIAVRCRIRVGNRARSRFCPRGAVRRAVAHPTVHE